jgi:hypothetical protein
MIVRKDSLTLLSCTGSAALVLMMGSGVNALMPPNLGDDGNSRIGIQTSSTTTSQEDAPVSIRQTVNARLKQLAQTKLGCTCTNCISTVRQMVQEGTLSL